MGLGIPLGPLGTQCFIHHHFWGTGVWQNRAVKKEHFENEGKSRTSEVEKMARTRPKVVEQGVTYFS